MSPDEPKETSSFTYVGNRVPRVIRFVWTAFILFSMIYMIRYALPDLKEWLSKVNGQ